MSTEGLLPIHLKAIQSWKYDNFVVHALTSQPLLVWWWCHCRHWMHCRVSYILHIHWNVPGKDKFHNAQAGLILRDFVLCDLALMWLENLHFSNLCNNFQFNSIWHRRSIAALIFCRRLAESDVTVMPSVPCMDWLHWWYNHAVCLLHFYCIGNK